MENVEDLPEGYTFTRYITRGDKYTFENVDDSWLKLCYYYDDVR